MGIINRFLLFLYGLGVGLLSLGVAAACLKLLPEHVWVNEMKYGLQQQETLAAVGVFLVLSIYFVLYCFFSSSDKKPSTEKEVILLKGADGEIKVAADAVRNVVEREAMAATFVRDAKARVVPMGKEEGTPLRLEVQLVLLSGANVPKVSNEVTSNVKTHLRQTMDIPDVPLEVSVSEITNAPVEKKRVV